MDKPIGSFKPNLSPQKISLLESFLENVIFTLDRGVIIKNQMAHSYSRQQIKKKILNNNRSKNLSAPALMGYQRMKLRACFIFMAVLLTVHGVQAEAPRYEMSPIAGMMGGSALIGLRASMNYHPVTLELATDQVMGHTATLYPVTLNAVLELADLKKTVPYGIVGGGLFLTVPTNSVGDQTVSSVGLCFGGGIRYYITSTIGIRFETKQLFTRIQNRTDNREELLIFQSTSLGVVFAFG